MEDSYQPKNQKYILIGLFLGVMLLFLAAISFILANSQKKQATNTPSDNTPTVSSTPKKITNTKKINPSIKPLRLASAPQANINQWIDIKRPFNPPTASNLYSFKQNYSLDEVKDFARKFFTFDNFKQSNDITLAYSVDNSTNQTSAIQFNKQTGSFLYISSKGVALNTNNASEGIVSFLKSINFYDSSIRMTATYKKKNQPNFTYWEYHRDWQYVGLPIFNPQGLVNLPENYSISSVTLTSKLPNLPQDLNIFNTTDGKDGFKRANDFNTMTVVVDNTTNTIVAINSNIRQMQTNAVRKVSLNNFDTALTKLKAGQYAFLFTSPVGNGAVDWKKIYPQNKALAEKATIQDAAYAYVEQTPNIAQTELQPYVLFQGTTQLQSGYNVKFIAAVPASNESKSVLGAQTKFIAQANGDNGADPEEGSPGNQQSNTNFDPGSTTNNCNITNDDLSPTFEFQGVTLGLGEKRIRYNADGSPIIEDQKAWYYMPDDPANTTEDDVTNAWSIIEQHLDEVDKIAISASQDEGGIGIVSKVKNGEHGRGIGLIRQDFQAIHDKYSVVCPILFSGLTPSLFVYGENGQTVSIRPGFKLTYAETPLINNIWNVTIEDYQKLKVNNLSRQYVFYEHPRVDFDKPQNGWNIHKKDLQMFADQIANKLNLNILETKRLYFELRHAATSVKNDKLFIGLIPQKEIDEKLPLEIVPQPDKVARLHFYVTAADGSVKAPSLKPIKRSEFMVIELGSTTE